MTKGIDISSWQVGLDLSSVKKAGYDFVIIRGAFTGYGEKRNKKKDNCFETFYAQAKKVGLGVGCYHYSCANTSAQGRAEAEFLYNNCLKGKQFDYPVYIDVEDPHWQNSNKKGVTDAIIAFCEYLENKGYFVGVYASLYWFNTKIDTARLKAYTKWVACWSSTKPSFNYNAFDMWQNSNNGLAGGKRVDTDIVYRDFPTVIRNGFNGYTKTTPSTPTNSTDQPKTLKVGSLIRIKNGAHVYGTTGLFMPWVYQTVYKVIEIRGNRVVFATTDGKTVMGAVTKAECIVQ